MEQLTAAYLPVDRYFALVEGCELPSRTSGAVLLADISGFTPLTEAYTRLLGPRRGAEELTRQLNGIYDALITEVTRYGGSVVGFSGDAITCWFDSGGRFSGCEGAPARALAAAFSMQRAMRGWAALVLPDGSEASIGVKTAVTSGTAHRFLVGDPAIQLIDILAGDPVTRVAAAEHLLSKGELAVDLATATQLEQLVEIAGWRRSDETGETFARVSGLNRAVVPSPWPDLKPGVLTDEVVRPWLLPPVYERLRGGGGDFHAELRPAVALFLRFTGINFDDADVGVRLDRYIRHVQGILCQYDGTLVQVTVGDKGSYLFAAFGAPAAHEDDERRAVNAAIALREPHPALDYITQQQIGISRGTMRVGAYGATSRRTYGVLSDETNVAARLMQHADNAEVLVTGRIQAATSGEFDWEQLPPIAVKGKNKPLPVSRLKGRRAFRQAAAFAGTLVGREPQFERLVGFARPLWRGEFAGLVYVSGEAGIGKSRLVHELEQRLRADHAFLWMTCPADEIFRDSLQPFRRYLRRYFDQSPEQAPEDNRERFDMTLDALLRRLERGGHGELSRSLDAGRSFLAALIDLYWDDSPYAQAEPRERFERSIAAFSTLVTAETLSQPVILHIEDGHWLDADSVECLKAVFDAGARSPLAVIVTCRYRDDGGVWTLDIADEVPQEIISLQELSDDSLRILAGQILSGEVSDQLATYLQRKTNGNPFFLEQCALDLRERGVLWKDGREAWAVSQDALSGVPGGLNAVLIARLDRLAQQVRTVIQTASVLGQEFELRVLSQMLAGETEVPALVREAERSAIWSLSREGYYVFRHALLRDAAYDMQLSARQRELHALAAASIELLYEEDADAEATELAYHYEQARDLERAAQWYATAGDHARTSYALENVTSYYRKALACWNDLEPDGAAETPRLNVLLGLGEALRWRNHSADAIESYKAAYAEAAALDDAASQAAACIGLAEVQYDLGDLRAALENATRAEEIALANDANLLLTRALQTKGWCLFRLGDLDGARRAGERALDVSTALDLPIQRAQSLVLLGMALMAAGENRAASERFERALEVSHDPIVVLSVTNNLGVIATSLGDYARAASCFEEALAQARRLAIAEAETVFLSNLGGAHAGLGAFARAEAELNQVIAMTGDQGFSDLSETYRFLAQALIGLGRLDEALEAASRALALGQEASAPEFEAIAWRVLGEIAASTRRRLSLQGARDGGRQAYSAADCFAHSLRICQATGLKGERPRTLRAWAAYELEQGDRAFGLSMWQQALDGFSQVGAVNEVQRMTALPN